MKGYLFSGVAMCLIAMLPNVKTNTASIEKQLVAISDSLERISESGMKQIDAYVAHDEFRAEVQDTIKEASIQPAKPNPMKRASGLQFRNVDFDVPQDCPDGRCPVLPRINAAVSQRPIVESYSYVEPVIVQQSAPVVVERGYSVSSTSSGGSTGSYQAKSYGSNGTSYSTQSYGSTGSQVSYSTQSYGSTGSTVAYAVSEPVYSVSHESRFVTGQPVRNFVRAQPVRTVLRRIFRR